MIVETLDSAMSALPPLLRIALWGILSAAISMGIYAKISPQKKMIAVKASQKEARSQLMRYDGDWDGLSVLIKRDLSLSMKHLGLTLLPFIISVTPLFLLMEALMPLYPDAYLTFGPDWMRGFEFSYIVVVLTCSLFIKYKFRIA